MSYRWRHRQRSCRVTVLQVIVALEVLVAVGLMAVGRIPPSECHRGAGHPGHIPVGAAHPGPDLADV